MRLVIGDIHGESGKLRRLLALRHNGTPLSEYPILFLGDYIDRGKDSRGVIEIVRSIPNAICLRGNHEELASKRYLYATWMNNGGEKTPESFGGEIPEDILAWMRDLPLVHHEKIGGRDYYFSHAGFSPGEKIIPQYEAALEGYSHTVLWERDHMYSSNVWEATVVCGHTPIEEPLVSERLIALDTGAVFGYALSAALITEAGVKIFSAE